MDNNNTQIGNWFLDQLSVYQTANSEYQSVKNNFIVRKVEYNNILDSILNKKIKDPLQHELILGRRGSGKSTLLKRIEIEIVENRKLNKHFIAINLAEEQAGIYRLFDLWEQVIDELRKQPNFSFDIQEYNSFENDQAYTRHLYTLMHENCARNNKRIILLLDNFDRIVENFTDDGSLLREILINYNDIQIIAGSTRMDEHFWRYDMPFYDFFRTHRLEALSRDEIHTLLAHWSNLLGIDALKEFVKNNPGKIENIRILTDGLPRTLQFFIQIVLQKSETSTYEYLKKTMDNVSPLYQERLNSLTAQLRKIVYEMAFIWEACTTKQLVGKTKMESKLVSANLKTLLDKGIVDKIETNKKQHLYRISERFFNMWLIITQGNPDQKRKAKWLSIFIENWYNATDFNKLTNEHIANLKSGKADWNSALLFSKALSQSKYISTAERDTIIELTESIKAKGMKNCIVELPEKYTVISGKILKYLEAKNYTEAIKTAESIENEKDGAKFVILGFLYNDQQQYGEAENYFLKAIEKGNNYPLNYLANLYTTQQKYSEAENYYHKAIDTGDYDALYNLANLYAIQEKQNEAEAYYLKAIDSGNSDALFNLANLYDSQQNHAKAETYYLKLIEMGNIDALNNLANIYDSQQNYAKAEIYYLQAIEKGNIDALNNLAILYKNNHNYTQAENYYFKAIDKGSIDALYNLANLYAIQKKQNEAEAYYLKAIDKGNIDAFNNLAVLFSNQQKYTESETYYLKAIDKGIDIALNNLANLYENQQRYSEAENYYLKAIDKEIIDAFHNLAILYYKANSNKEKALELTKLANEKKDSNILKETQLIVEIWNGIFNNIENRALSIIASKDDVVIKELIIDLLVQQQKSLVLRLFQHKDYGIELQEKYIVLYYATLIINKEQDDNLSLKIPPEIQGTIDEVLANIEKQERMYGYS